MHTSKNHSSVERGETTTLTIRVARSLKEQLGDVAKHQRRSKSFLAAHAIEEFLSIQDWKDERIKDAIHCADRKKVVDHNHVAAWIEKWDSPKELKPPAA